MSQQQWDAEFRVGESLALELLESQFPDLRPVSLTLLGEGWDNVAWLVNGRVVFRFPRRKLAVGLLDHESRVLPGLVGLPLALPRPVFFGLPTPRYPYRFSGYEMLAGTTACRVHPTDAARRTMAPFLGRFLRRLHDHPVDGLDLPGDELGRLECHRRRPRLVETLHRLQGGGLVADVDEFRGVVECEDGSPATPCLVHGDLYSRHLLLDETGALCGVIDWGDVHCGNRAVDLAVVHGFLPPDAHAAFFDSYGPCDPAAWDVARWRALYHACYVSDYSHQTQDADLLQEGLRSIEYIRAACRARMTQSSR